MKSFSGGKNGTGRKKSPRQAGWAGLNSERLPG